MSPLKINSEAVGSIGELVYFTNNNLWLEKCNGSLKYIKYVPGNGKKRVHNVDGCEIWRGLPEYMDESRTFISILPFLFYTLRCDRIDPVSSNVVTKFIKSHFKVLVPHLEEKKNVGYNYDSELDKLFKSEKKNGDKRYKNWYYNLK
ncbi:hypothetical protein ACTFIW_008378 [Dictyostelium discoideum]